MSLVTTITPTYDIPRSSQEVVLQLESWYHGLLTRLRSECLVRSEGDFLVSVTRVETKFIKSRKSCLVKLFRALILILLFNYKFIELNLESKSKFLTVKSQKKNSLKRRSLSS